MTTQSAHRLDVGCAGAILSARKKADEYVKSQTIPVMIGADGASVQRNFVHVEDLVEAILCAFDAPKAQQQTFNICMDEPVNY